MDEILLYDEKISGIPLFKFVNHLRSFEFTHSFSLLPQEKLNYILFLAGIKNRIGVGHKFYQFITNTKSVYRRNYNPLRHEADYCMDFVRKLGIETDSIYPEIFLSESEKLLSQKNKLKYLNGKKFLLGVNSTSGGSAPNWKTERYVELIQTFTESTDLQVVVTDKDVPSELLGIDGVSYFAPAERLRTAIIDFSTLDCLISSSTGPMHIAAALGVPTISLFCPLPACSPKLWGALGNKGISVLPSGNYCSSVCHGDPKICNFEGEGGISVEQIVEQL